MSTKLENAVTAIKALPEEAQDAIAEQLIAKVRAHRQLNDELAAAEARLDAGEGIPADQVIAELRRQQERHDV